jgi:cobalt/nickel transport system permease protein
MGLASAFVFAAQMLNFPVAGGTSGHLVGSVLVAVLLGPRGAIVVMTSVLIVQALVFADGGLLALGANVLNIAIIGSGGGYAVYVFVRRFLPPGWGDLAAAGFASWCSIVTAACVVAGELAWSGTVSWGFAFPAMVSVHMLVGLGEAVLTVFVLAAVGGTRKEILENARTAFTKPWERVVYGLVILLGIMIFVAPYASPLPDGLERILGSLSSADVAAGAEFPAPLSGYIVPGFGSSPFSMAVAGGVGAIIAFLVSVIIARLAASSSIPRKS